MQALLIKGGIKQKGAKTLASTSAPVVKKPLVIATKKMKLVKKPTTLGLKKINLKKKPIKLAQVDSKLV